MSVFDENWEMPITEEFLYKMGFKPNFFQPIHWEESLKADNYWGTIWTKRIEEIRDTIRYFPLSQTIGMKYKTMDFKHVKNIQDFINLYNFIIENGSIYKF